MNDDINIDIKITNKNSKVLTLNDYKAYLSIIENRFLQDNNIKSFIDNAKFIMELVESEFQLKRCNLRRENHQYLIDDLDKILNQAYRIDEFLEHIDINSDEFYIFRYYNICVKFDGPINELRDMKKELTRLIIVAIEDITLYKKRKQREADKRYSIKRSAKYVKRKNRKNEYFECFKKGLSVKDIAKRLNVTEQSVYAFAKRNNIDISKCLCR
ncbi:TPA: hypothetical protein ACF32C_002794 [Clostridium perfringens]|uniref:hypothetical protein n=2 Tax=Clostridium perfringens TaxID=1502 RepID=UPI001897C5F8|nr:hypothetical protein [Clostridium perfringens]MDB2047155.1 hypothetical protein [Clostridium perfringens]MDB2058762.1 hypothetical protein [Clostridium perfringens]UNM61941.1 hypothetical protein MN196_15465 [Clostridium perfringens]